MTYGADGGVLEPLQMMQKRSSDAFIVAAAKLPIPDSGWMAVLKEKGGRENEHQNDIEKVPGRLEATKPSSTLRGSRGINCLKRCGLHMGGFGSKSLSPPHPNQCTASADELGVSTPTSTCASHFASFPARGPSLGILSHDNQMVKLNLTVYYSVTIELPRCTMVLPVVDVSPSLVEAEQADTHSYILFFYVTNLDGSLVNGSKENRPSRRMSSTSGSSYKQGRIKGLVFRGYTSKTDDNQAIDEECSKIESRIDT
ncbi:hypothetical protein EDD22DRAFT_850262 [Suillus occidentalis]|nr:hypothetical protein EDD22DRAFT_850262 [Suillus occidentalis]